MIIEKFGNIICKSLETKIVQYMHCLDKLHMTVLKYITQF